MKTMFLLNGSFELFDEKDNLLETIDYVGLPLEDHKPV